MYICSCWNFHFDYSAWWRVSDLQTHPEYSCSPCLNILQIASHSEFYTCIIVCIMWWRNFPITRLIRGLAVLYVCILLFVSIIVYAYLFCVVSVVWFVCIPYVPSVLWYCWLGLLTCKNRLPYNLYCVGGDVKHCTIQSNLIQYKYKLITLEFCGRRELQNMIHIVNSYLTVASKGSTLRATAGCRGDKNQLWIW